MAEERQLLVETLRLRLCKSGVQVLQGGSGADSLDRSDTVPGPREALAETACGGPLPPSQSGAFWLVHLEPLTDRRILVAVDYLGDRSAEDAVKEVMAEPDIVQTVWTIALVIEEAVLPYLKSQGDLEPVGVGLAISEPRQVGGVKKSDEVKPDRYPRLRWVGAGLGLYYAGTVTNTVDDLLLGPKAALAGLLGPRVVALISIGWLGNAHFSQESSGVKGTVSHVPIDILFGYVALPNKFVDLSVLGGASTGFTVIKTDSDFRESQRTDIYFDPWLELRFDATVYAYGPLALYLQVGIAFPLIQDVVENAGVVVYEQDWIMPFGGVGAQLWL